MRRALFLLAAVVVAGCSRGIPEVLQVPGPYEVPREYTVQIPDGYDVRSATFGTSYAASVSGGAGDTAVTGSSTQDAYVSVFAVERATGQEVVLVYGDIRRRAEPVAIIRLARGGRSPGDRLPGDR